ncbi:MAG: acyl-CoA thioesterase [Sphingomonadales bacterium]
MIETYRGAVYPNELDHMGHMNVQYYTAKFDSATWHLFNEVGLNRSYFEDNLIGMAAVEQTTNYKQELFAGDIVHIRSQIIDIKNRAFKFQHFMYNSSTDFEVARTQLVAAHIDQKTRKSCSINDYIKEKMVTLLA